MQIPSLRVVAIIQARMGSSRLPGKTLQPILGRPLLGHLVERLKRSKLLSDIIIATTNLPEDNAIVEFANSNSIPVFRGSSADVLQRYLLAARESGAAVIVRITGDCPLIDSEVVDQGIHLFLTAFPQYDFVSNTLQRTFPRGLDVEIFSRQALEKAAAKAVDANEREHVTLHIVRHPELFSLFNFCYKQDYSRYRWTVDTKEDFTLVAKLMEMSFPINPSFEELLQLHREHPELELINAHIIQKMP
ncbi:MAG: cytidylyltransferase domain-containing protein [Parachlamydiaceae bacterium]